MLQGCYPGSIKAPIETHSKLIKKRDALFDLYKQHFKKHLSLNAVLNRAEIDRRLASQIYINFNGQPMVTVSLIANSDYFKKSIQDFINEAKSEI